MSQQLVAVDASVPSGDTGTTLAEKLNDWRSTIITQHSGSARPSYAAGGTLWLDSSATPWVLKMFDGSADVSIAEVDPATHAVTRVYSADATSAEVLAGTIETHFVSPAGLQSRIASVAQYRARTAGYIPTTDVIASALAEVTIAEAATITADLNTLVNGVVTLTANRIMGLPSNRTEGLSGRIRIVQGGAGSKTLTWAAGWQFSGKVAPTLSTAAGAVDILYYDVLPGGDVHGSLVSNVGRP